MVLGKELQRHDPPPRVVTADPGRDTPVGEASAK